MEQINVEKKSKAKVKPATTAPLRVRIETRKRVLSDVAKANKKDFGKRVRVEDLIALAIGLIEAKHIQTLQEGSLSNADRLDRDYHAYIAKHGHISKDTYLGKLMNGEISAEQKIAPEVKDKTSA